MRHEAKRVAAETGRTLTAVVADALREALFRRPPAKNENKFELPAFNTGPPLSGVDLNNSAALLDLMEEDDGPL